MTLASKVEELTQIAAEGEELESGLRRLVELKREPGDRKSQQVKTLAQRLAHTADAAGKSRLTEELEELDTAIRLYEGALLTPGIRESLRHATRAILTQKRARRTRLKSRQGLDFGGMLTRKEIEQLTALVAEAEREVKRKKMGALLLNIASTIVDFSLTIAGKLAMKAAA